MIRLIVRDMRYHASAWSGAFLVAVLCGCLGGWALALRASVDAAPEAVRFTLIAGAESIVMFSTVAAVIVLVCTACATVGIQRKTYALWQLAGASPFRVGTIVAVQLLVVGAIGAVAGTLIASGTLFLPVALLARLNPGLAHADIVANPAAFPIVWAGVAGIFLIGGLKGAIDAGRTPALLALRGDVRRARGFTAARAVFLLVVMLCSAWLVSFCCTSVDNAMRAGVFVPSVFSLVVALAAPVAMPVFLRAWTALVGVRFDAWYLARRAAARGVAVDSAVETPIVAAFSILAGFFSFLAAVLSYGKEYGQDVNVPDIVPIVFMLGGPVLVFALGAAVGVIAAVPSRTSDISLMAALGARPAMQVASVVGEAFIHATTASLAGVCCTVASSFVYARTFGIDVMGAVSLAPGLAVYVLGFALILIAALAPAMRALRADPARCFGRVE